MGETRVVLVKPGDVLILGVKGVGGDFHLEGATALLKFFEEIGIKVVMVDGDVSMGKLAQASWDTIEPKFREAVEGRKSDG
jgi:hypothetical protein